MSDALLAVPAAEVAKLARMAPFVATLAVLYLVLAALGAYDGHAELTYYGLRQPARIPHLIVVYTSFEILALLSAWRAAQAAHRLARLRHVAATAGLLEALAKLHDTLRLSCAWLLAALAAFAWLRFLPQH